MTKGAAAALVSNAERSALATNADVSGEMLADDFAMGSPGTCGKDGQGVPVGDGQPTLRVKAMTIGGTAS